MKTLLVGLFSLALAAPAGALTVQGKEYAPTMIREGRTLKLIGAGLRKKFGLARVYTMGAYSESAPCGPAEIIDHDEAKALRMDFLRNVDADTMVKTLRDSFDDHLPRGAPGELKAQVARFLDTFKERLTEGTVLEFVYVPGRGTQGFQNGKALGDPMPGAAFMRLLWDIYFGVDTCCSGLKDGILETCGR